MTYHNATNSNVFYSRYGDQTTPWINEQHEADLKILNRIAVQLGLFVRMEFRCTRLNTHTIVMRVENHRFSFYMTFNSTWFLNTEPMTVLGAFSPNFEKFIERIKDAHALDALAG